MKIAMIGYGKMGKAIESVALEEGHDVALKIDLSNQPDFTEENLSRADVAIEFTGPDSAVSNIRKCFAAGLPVVSGSTGWLEQWQEVADDCRKTGGGFLYASNFSIGVNLFFAMNRYVAQLMEKYTDYHPMIHEIHHAEKKDAPSGTALTLAEQILAVNSRIKGFKTTEHAGTDDCLITSERKDPAPGTHIITWRSAVDTIRIEHDAHSRMGFAKGAVLAAAYLAGKKGLYTMADVLGF
jgi:4-hydroxy-tetrahydrodipicolinate reductase